MTDGGHIRAGGGSVTDVAVAEPLEELQPRARSDAPRRIGIAVAVALCIVAAAIPVTIRLTSSRTSHPQKHATEQPTTRNEARVAVSDALGATVAARSYRITSVMSEADAPGTTSPGNNSRGMTIDAQATVNVDPPAMVATSDVGGLGAITSWSNNEKVWEQGGGSYGLVAGSGVGAGAPLSGFSASVEGTLGPREGGIAMMSLSSPAGYLDLADQAITSASAAGTSTVGGVQLTEYDITLDAAQLVSRPGMSAEQVQAATEGLEFLRRQNYTRTTVRLGVDAAGFVREAHTVWMFADGGSVTTEVTYSDFGCAGTVVLPTQTPSPPPVATCTSPDPGATTVTTFPKATTGTVEPVDPVGTDQDAVAAITYTYGHFFDPALSADQRAALVQGSAEMVMRNFMLKSFTEHEGEAAAGAVIVDTAEVHGDTADVTFHALLGGHESPANPGEIDGTAVLENGVWKISRATYCSLSANDGEVCPPNVTTVTVASG